MTDINECLFEATSCDSSFYDCINTYGGFYCQCKLSILCEDDILLMCPPCIEGAYCDHTTNSTCQCMAKSATGVTGGGCPGVFTILYTKM